MAWRHKLPGHFEHAPKNSFHNPILVFYAEFDTQYNS